MKNISEMKDFILSKVLRIAEKSGSKTPVSTDDSGKFKYGEIWDWRLGFWPGILNYCYLMSGNKKYLDYAQLQRPALIDRLYNMPETLDHDIGFLYVPTEYANYKINGDEESLRICIDAADKLMERYNEKGKYIVAWNYWDTKPDFSKNNDRRIIIDCMFNLPLLFEVSKITGDSKYYEAALGHARTCMNAIVRPDATTYHTYLFDRETGKPDRGETWQGYSDDSCWSRGQAWAIGGFAMAYRFTGEKDFLSTSVAVADKFISLLDDNFLPAWDFVFQNKGAVPDASAAGIAACGLLELAQYVDSPKAEFFEDSAKKLINALWQNCASHNDDGFEALIKRSTGFYRENFEVDTGIIYGDYYFVKAVAKLNGTEWIL